MFARILAKLKFASKGFCDFAYAKTPLVTPPLIYAKIASRDMHDASIEYGETYTIASIKHSGGGYGGRHRVAVVLRTKPPKRMSQSPPYYNVSQHAPPYVLNASKNALLLYTTLRRHSREDGNPVSVCAEEVKNAMAVNYY